MSPNYIDAIIREFARVLAASAYSMRWIDKFCLCEGHHLRIPPISSRPSIIACAMRDIADQLEHLLWNDRPH